jgi:hypothetical protein
MDFREQARALAVRGAVLLAALVALTVIINLPWFDERLDPEIERLAQPEPVSMDDNAYPLVYGFAAADDRDPLAAGLAIVAAQRERYSQGRPIGLTTEEMAAILGASGLDAGWRAQFPSLPCNSRTELDCADRLVAEIAQGAPPHARLAVLLERYERVLAASRFEENQEFDVTSPVPDYGLLVTVSRIRLATSYRQDPTTAFLARAGEDLAFWRRMLRNSHTLIAKMVALAGVRNGLEWLSAALRNRELGADEIATIEQLAQPLTRDESNISEAFLSEFRIALLTRKPVILGPGDAWWRSGLLLQEQATLNELYLTTVTPIRRRAALDPETFYAERGYEPLGYDLRLFPPPLYNLAGKLLLKQQAQNYNVQDYVSRVHDLDGRLTLVRLQAAIERSAGRSVAAVVSASAQRNPYTRQPMVYDAAKRTIGFRCLAHNVNDVCAVSLGAAAR